MERKVERRAGRGLEHRNRRSPMVAVSLSGWIGVERGECREIARADCTGAGAVFEQSGKLRPIGRLKPKIFARDHGARVGQRAPRHAHVTLQLRRRIG